MSILVRLAIEDDAKRIGELLYQVHDVHANIRPDLFKKGARKYNEEQVKELINNPGIVSFVGIENNKVLGYAICYKREENVKTLYIDDICVDEVKRNMHVGKTIYEYVEKYAKENGFYNITLRVWSGNDSARAFYDSLGFKVLYSGMEKKL